jgi:hypothetical protein
VNQIIDRKLAKGEEPNFGYGKLMERLLFFQKNGVGFYQKLIPIAEKRLSQYNIPLEPPVRYNRTRTTRTTRHTVADSWVSSAQCGW